MKTIPILILSLLALSLPALSQTTLTGTVTGADGKIPVTAQVLLSDPNGGLNRPMDQTVIGKDGSFSLKIPNAGTYYIFVATPSHDVLMFPVITDQSMKNISVQVRPEALKYVNTINEVKIIGSWNKFDFSTAQTMKRKSDGTFTFTTTVPKEWDTVRYQLLNIVADIDGSPTQRSINGTQHDHFTYDGGGDFFSVVKTKKGSVTVSFDPKKLLRAQQPASVAFNDAPGLNDLYTIHSGMLAKMTEVRLARMNRSATPPDFSDLVSKIKPFLNSSDKSVTQFAAMQFVTLLNYGYQPDSTLAQAILRAVPPSSSMWEMNPFSLGFFASVVGKEQGKKVLREFVKQSPSRTVQGFALVALTRIAIGEGNTQESQSYYEDLKTNYANIRSLNYDIMNLNPDRATAAGKKVPDFEVKLLSGETVSNKSMLGKYYMIDFWATWCGPCVGEMPSMHAAYEKFNKRGLNILSLSFDRTVDVIQPFRDKKWKMPWMHTFLEGGFTNDISKRFEVVGIPKPILVGPDGTILATEEDLRGDMLGRTLAKYLGGS